MRSLQRALELEREKLVRLFQDAPFAVVVYEGPEHIARLSNPRHDEMTSGRLALGKPLLESLPELADTATISILDEVYREGVTRTARELELPALRDGKLQQCWFDVTWQPLPDVNGGISGVIVSAVEVTEYVRARRKAEAAEKAVQESEAQFHTLADSIPHLAWIAEADGSIHWYNRRWYEYTGTTLEEMLDQSGWGWRKVHDPAELPRVESRFRAAIATGEPWEDTFPLRRHDGQLRWHLSRAMPVRDAEGTIVRWFGTNTDVEDQRRAEAALKASEARLRGFVEANLIGIIFFDIEGGVTEANDAFLRSVGYTRDDLEQGRIDWRALTPPEWHAQDALLVDEMLRTGKHHPAEKQYFRKDGTRLPLIVASTFFPGSRRKCVGFILDISERKAAEAERKAAEEQQRRVYEFQDRLIGIVSHDIRSPTAAILTTSQMLLARFKLDPNVRRPLERIARSAGRVEDLIGSLLDYTRARIGSGIPIERKDSSLREVVGRCVELAHARHPEREVVASLADSVNGQWDTHRLAQIISSLLDNALKYGDPGKPVRVSLREHDGEAVLEVHNEGPSISEDLLPSLFEPFRRGEQSDETIKLSLGLGLYIVREVVTAHGGRVEVDSAPLQGTTFRVRLLIAHQPSGAGERSRDSSCRR